ncbi:hypothetical protein DL95DRAFT_511793 [Leptodontidium sp. 2 PMI_412]|nr:hypothetical protein BKA61DRAFT_682180 [Leptodontidium sp. MPI-SDFR-AT-0119]KAH9221832.1 hypothetical protein DL95DRAFT_511793 [Leptodontidium sp. 2 PMI_412]
MKPSTFFALLSALAPGVLSEFLELEVNFVPTLDISILDQPCVGKFMDPKVPTFVYYDELEKRQTEPDPDRNVTLQDDLVFVLQCVNAGFREPCTVFGAPPGACVSYFDFQSGNDTSISRTYNDAVSSISTNTGGKCQFYKYLGCNNKGDDRGLTVDYNYNLAVAPDGDDRVPEYENQITSWRC